MVLPTNTAERIAAVADLTVSQAAVLGDTVEYQQRPVATVTVT